MKTQKPPQPKALDAEYFIVPPPATMTVEATPRVVLFKPDGTPLKRPIGFIKACVALCLVGLSGCAARTPAVVGRTYEVVYSCNHFVTVKTCYAEGWTVLELQPGGWVRFRDIESGEVWFGNLNSITALRERSDVPTVAPAPQQPQRFEAQR